MEMQKQEWLNQYIMKSSRQELHPIVLQYLLFIEEYPEAK